MRVTNVEMHAPTLEEPIDFSLRYGDSGDRYVVRSILGLDAEEIISKFYGWSLNSSSVLNNRYYSMSMQERDIVMQIILNPQFRLDESYSDVRDDLYRAISSTREGGIDLHFKSGATTVSHIKGFITKFEVPYFVKLPEVQLTVRCDDPMFRAVNPVLHSTSDLPLTNPVKIADTLSTSPHGFEMQVTFDGTSPALTIQDDPTTPNWKFTVTPSGGFLVGDVLHFSSEFSNKFLYIVRGETTIELVDKVSPSSVWPLIFPGQNVFYFLEIDKFNWDYITYYASYWGYNMDLFKFTPVSSPTTLDQAATINGYSRVTWVERYSDLGEFTIEAKLSSGLTSFLPLGSLISHVDSMEVMIVENHEVMEKRAEDPMISITGRTFPSFLENRIIGMNAARATTTLLTYTLAAGYTWVQAAKMINDHIGNPPANANDTVDNVVANYSATGTGESIDRPITLGPVLPRVLELLKIDDLGIRTIRRNPFGVTGGSATETRINIYKGEDKTSRIMFSWVSGDIAEAQYLFSLKNERNSALVRGQYIQVVVDGSETKYDRRTMLVDGTDIDGHYGSIPTGADLTAVVAAMTTRGHQALSTQNQTSITEVQLASTAKPQYRKDFNVGDLVSIDGNFGQIAVRRISEYAEIEDENSKTGSPTLSVPGA